MTKRDEDDDSRRSDDVDINLLGIHLRGSVKALVSLLTGTFSVLGLIALVAYHVIVDIQYNEKIISRMDQITASVNLQSAILITPQDHRAVFANKLPADTKRSLGYEEMR